MDKHQLKKELVELFVAQFYAVPFATTSHRTYKEYLYDMADAVATKFLKNLLRDDTPDNT
jgi:hypothetical protein